MPPTTPADLATDTPAPLAATPAPAAAPSPVASEEPLQGSDAVAQAVTGDSQTIGDAIATLDNIALSFGSTRVSLWDALVVVLVIAGIFVLAWIISKLSHAVLKRMTKLGAARRLLAEKILTIVVWAIAIMASASAGPATASGMILTVATMSPAFTGLRSFRQAKVMAGSTRFSASTPAASTRKSPAAAAKMLTRPVAASPTVTFSA